jgi:hypothetical protein
LRSNHQRAAIALEAEHVGNDAEATRLWSIVVGGLSITTLTVPSRMTSYKVAHHLTSDQDVRGSGWTREAMMLDGLGQIVILNGPPCYRRKGM